MNELHDMIMAQAICDSLTSRSTGIVYAIYEENGYHKVIRVDRVFKCVDVIASEATYETLVDVLLAYLEEVVSNA